MTDQREACIRALGDHIRFLRANVGFTKADDVYEVARGAIEKIERGGQGCTTYPMACITQESGARVKATISDEYFEWTIVAGGEVF